MSLVDTERGEVIGKFGRKYRVVPASKWTDMPFWTMAHAEALRVFANTVRQERMAQIRPLFEIAVFPPDSVLCQEYYGKYAALVFIFSAKVGSKEKYHPVTFVLRPEEVNQLILMGRWHREGAH